MSPEKQFILDNHRTMTRTDLIKHLGISRFRYEKLTRQLKDDGLIKDQRARDPMTKEAMGKLCETIWHHRNGQPVDLDALAAAHEYTNRLSMMGCVRAYLMRAGFANVADYCQQANPVVPVFEEAESRSRTFELLSRPWTPDALKELCA